MMVCGRRGRGATTTNGTRGRPPWDGPVCKEPNVNDSKWTRREFLETSLKTGGAFGASAFAFGGQPSPGGTTMQATDFVSATTIQVAVNGAPQAITVDVCTSLLDLLRERLQLHGTKKGCNHGACGACTVLVDGRRVLSCLTLAATCDGAAVTTSEGLAQGDRLHPLQAAFIEHEAFQCGYCTPGQILSGVACIAEGHAGSPAETREWMSGNICRCGAYPGIIAAISRVAREG
jgi:xanthine dehydrogenase YagT iron-sulfur-binding subunit